MLNVTIGRAAPPFLQISKVWKSDSIINGWPNLQLAAGLGQHSLGEICVQLDKWLFEQTPLSNRRTTNPIHPMKY